MSMPTLRETELEHLLAEAEAMLADTIAISNENSRIAGEFQAKLAAETKRANDIWALKNEAYLKLAAGDEKRIDLVLEVDKLREKLAAAEARVMKCAKDLADTLALRVDDAARIASLEKQHDIDDGLLAHHEGRIASLEAELARLKDGPAIGPLCNEPARPARRRKR